MGRLYIDCRSNANGRLSPSSVSVSGRYQELLAPTQQIEPETAEKQ
jgi:hypothetical protein